jgi:hypothetical protein
MSERELIDKLTVDQLKGIMNMITAPKKLWIPFLIVWRYPFQDSKKKVDFKFIRDLNEVEIFTSVEIFSTSLVANHLEKIYSNEK